MLSLVQEGSSNVISRICFYLTNGHMWSPAMYRYHPPALAQSVSNLFHLVLEDWNYPDLEGLVLYTTQLLLTHSSAKGPHPTSASPPPMPAVSLSLMSSHFCVFSSSLFHRGKRLRCCIWGFSGGKPPMLPPLWSPMGEDTAETSWQGHFASRSLCKPEAISLWCKQTTRLILIVGSSGSRTVECVCVCQCVYMMV